MSITRCRFVAGLLGLILMGLVCTDVAQAQERGRGRGGPGGGGGGGGGQPLTLLQRQDVQAELELLDDQKKQLTALAEKNLESSAGLRGADNFLEAITKLNQETLASIDKILLPPQQKRFKQLVIQNRMRTGGGFGGFGFGAGGGGRGAGGRGGGPAIGLGAVVNGDTAQQLGVSEDLQEKLRAKGNELEQEVAKKTMDARFQLLDQLLADLTPDQRTKLKEMIGAPFTFKDEPGQFGGGRGGARGDGGGRGRGKRAN